MNEYARLDQELRRIHALLLMASNNASDEYLTALHEEEHAVGMRMAEISRIDHNQVEAYRAAQGWKPCFHCQEAGNTGQPGKPEAGKERNMMEMQTGDTIAFGDGSPHAAHVDADGGVYYEYIHTPISYPPDGPPIRSGNDVRSLRFLGQVSEFEAKRSGQTRVWRRRRS